ncbi:MAG TPA: DoxX family protein [Steroidobacteraceae bacterium]|nr:DoxX family protein [Steroidobacteraceae bacterium]
MDLPSSFRSLNTLAARIAAIAVDPALLLLRVWVSWQFLKSGWLKLADWETTRFLFTEEYHVPWLPPTLAAALGTFGEVAFPALLVVGILGRYAALGLAAVNVMAVVAYAHVLYAAGYEGALAQHWLWGLALAVLVVFGPGAWSVDGWLARSKDAAVSAALTPARR